MPAFSDWLRDKLRVREWNETKLAEELGTYPGNVNRWVKGTIPKAQTIERIADVFNVDVSEPLRLAGYPFDRADDGNDVERAIAIVVRALPHTERQMVLEFARFRREQARRRGV